MVLCPFCSSCKGHWCEARGGTGSLQPWGDMGEKCTGWLGKRKIRDSGYHKVISLLLDFLPHALPILRDAHKVNVQVVIG